MHNGAFPVEELFMQHARIACVVKCSSYTACKDDACSNCDIVLCAACKDACGDVMLCS